MDNIRLIETLLDIELFPVKDSYIPFMRHDSEATLRNPQTVNRIAGSLYQMGIDAIIEKCTAPKETNRQMGPLFKNWIAGNVIGVPILKDYDEFLDRADNCILNLSDNAMQKLAADFLGFRRNKGVDFIAKFNGKYIAGEAKFLTDFGGHQNAQFEDALASLHSFKKSDFTVIPIAILDGVIYLKKRNKMYEYLLTHPKDNIMPLWLCGNFFIRCRC